MFITYYPLARLTLKWVRKRGKTKVLKVSPIIHPEHPSGTLKTLKV